MEMERQQHSRTPQANDPKRDRNSGQRSMGHIEANSRAEGQEDSRRRTISFSSEMLLLYSIATLCPTSLSPALLAK